MNIPIYGAARAKVDEVQKCKKVVYFGLILVNGVIYFQNHIEPSPIFTLKWYSFDRPSVENISGLKWMKSGKF